MMQMKIQNVIIAMFLCATHSMVAPAFASGESEFASGVSYYKGKNYRLAAKEFEASISHGNITAPVFLYAAHSYMAYGDRNEALRKYHQIIELFKDTPSANMAKEALMRLDANNSWVDRKPELLASIKKQLEAQNKKPDAEKKTPAQTSDKNKDKTKTAKKEKALGDGIDDSVEDNNPQAVASKISDNIPTTSRVFYESSGKDITVNVRINGQSIPLLFDTGAPGICIDKEMAKGLGLVIPQGKADGKTGGSSNMALIDYWNINATVQVGSIIRENTRVKIYEKIQSRPLLGQSFFKDFDYTIDHSAKCIEFRKKGMSTAAGQGYSVPFTFKKEGRRIIVDVEVNGKKGPMMLDTGNTASGIAFKSKAQLKKFGIDDVPYNATRITTVGVSGSGSAYSFTIGRVRLGPIDKINLSADLALDVVDHEDLPLLGQQMLSGWQYTIDMEKKVIHFLKR